MNSNKMMKAMRFHAVNEPLHCEEIPIPEIGPQDVLIRVKANGICGSDLHILYEGSVATSYQPIVLGHEPGGIIAEVGSHVTGWKQGDRVVVNGVLTCGYCGYCLSGNPTLCTHMKMIGINRDGAMAEYVVVPASHILRLPDNIPFDQGAILTDAVATPYHAIVKRAVLKEGEKVAVIGCGGLGYHAIQLCRILGASRIIAVDADEYALERTRKAGATDLILAHDNKTAAEIRQIAGDGVDLALEFVGYSATISLCLKILRGGGRVVVSGVTREKIIAPPPSLFVWQQYSLIGSFGYEMKDIRDLVELARSGVLDLSGSVTEKFPLEQANTAMEHLRDKIGKPIRIVIEP